MVMSIIGDRKLHVLLSLREEPAHGYQLTEKINEVEISKPYIYTILDELEDADLIEVVETEEEGRERKTYSITDNGELLLKALER
jgi:DNA-binding PadR family transcriptional regulator